MVKTGSLKYQVFLKWSQVMVIHLMICRYLQKAVLYHAKSYTMYFKCKNVSKVEGTFETLMKQLEKAKKADAGSDENEITGYTKPYNNYDNIPIQRNDSFR